VGDSQARLNGNTLPEVRKDISFPGEMISVAMELIFMMPALAVKMVTLNQRQWEVTHLERAGAG